MSSDESTDEDVEDAVDASPDDETTEGPRWRWRWLSTVVSFLTIAVFLALVALDAAGAWGVDLGSVNAYVLAAFVLGFLGALGYSIGTDTLNEVSDLLDEQG